MTSWSLWPGSCFTSTLLRRLRLCFSPGCEGSGCCGSSGTVLGRLRARLLPRLLQRGAGFVEAGRLYDYLDLVVSSSRFWLVLLVLRTWRSLTGAPARCSWVESLVLSLDSGCLCGFLPVTGSWRFTSTRHGSFGFGSRCGAALTSVPTTTGGCGGCGGF